LTRIVDLLDWSLSGQGGSAEGTENMVELIDARRTGLQLVSTRGWRVICEDGVDRGGLFRFRHEAVHFIEWGHCCTNRHTFARE
jgi:hypothetical protein